MASLSTYAARHTQAMLGALGRLARAPIGTVMTIVVIGLALALPLGLHRLVQNARIASGDFANAVDLSVYFKPEVPLQRATQLASNARERSGVAAVTLVSADDALEEFREFSGFGAALESLEGNPLPHVLNVRPAAASADPAALESLRRYFGAWPEVELVQIDTEWVQRFNAILETLRRALSFTAAMLAVGVVAVIGNTIRLEILNRRSEIEVTKLVGGSNAFVRRPFLYSGVLYGLLGGLLGALIVLGGIAALDGPISTLAQLYGSSFALAGPPASEIAMLVGGGVVLGWLGAWVAAARQLARIEPRA